MKIRNYIYRIAALLVLVSMLAAVFTVAVSAATGTLTRNQAMRHVVCDSRSTKANNYYTGEYTYDALSQLSGVSAPNNSYSTTQNNPLYTALQTLMTDTHKVYTEYNPSGETRTELSYLWDYTDAVSGKSQ